MWSSPGIPMQGIQISGNQKYAIRVDIFNVLTKAFVFYGYLTDNGLGTSKESFKTFGSVTDAVAMIVNTVRNSPHLTKNDRYDIVGVEWPTSVREIPLQTL